MSTGGVICAKRNLWEVVPKCYAQPPEEYNTGEYQVISQADSKKDPVKYCREMCQINSRYFDIKKNTTATFCHCINTPLPLGGFLEEQECFKLVCEPEQSPAVDDCHYDDGYRRTFLYRAWKTSCSEIEPDLSVTFTYVWEHHGSWHWGSKATLRCLPGYILPIDTGDAVVDREMSTQIVKCEYDEFEGGKWTDAVPCEPIKCRAAPPDVPNEAVLTVINSLDPATNQQAETILTYTCAKEKWAFDYPYDTSLPSFAFTKNINNITISCNYSTYWEYDYGIEGSICMNEQIDGSCERILIPDCVDRTVYCNPLDSPHNSSKTILQQPDKENEVESDTQIMFTCPQYQHYFDYSVPDDLVSYYYSTNINVTILTCNDHKFWTVKNGLNGETCVDKKSGDDELWCEYVMIPECVDRKILCSDPPMPERSMITYLNKPHENVFEYKTEINYKCTDRNHYFDYPVPQDFVSFHYTTNVDDITVKCTKDAVWEVTGGIQDLTCINDEKVNSTNNTKLYCESLTIPACEDRTIYCTFPPENILGGEVSVENNPSPSFKKNENCRWTKWFNVGKGSKGDKEQILELFGLYSWQVCPKPRDMKVRIASSKEIVEKTGGVQIFDTFDTETGFVCKDSDQVQGKCFDYEVQLCCPYAPEVGTEVMLTCTNENWYLDFDDAPFITTMSASCTQNSTWVSDVESGKFCRDGSNECITPFMPECQDRNIVCLDELPIPKDMLQANASSNETLHGFALGAAYEYSCEEEGFVIDMPNYPEALIVQCVIPKGYPVDWYYNIWKDGIWNQAVIILISISCISVLIQYLFQRNVY